MDPSVRMKLYIQAEQKLNSFLTNGILWVVDLHDLRRWKYNFSKWIRAYEQLIEKTPSHSPLFSPHSPFFSPYSTPPPPWEAENEYRLVWSQSPHLLLVNSLRISCLADPTALLSSSKIIFLYLYTFPGAYCLLFLSLFNGEGVYKHRHHVWKYNSSLEKH